MSFSYKHVLLVGATSGIGRAMADRLILEGVKVTAVGRRKDRLDDFISKSANENATAIQFDQNEVEKTPKFAAETMKTYPDIDCVFLNAGVQHPYQIGETFDLEKFNKEIHTNFTSVVALIHAFLPFLHKGEQQTSFIISGTHLSIIPATTLTAYSASKAALNSFTMCLRDQLRATNIKVIEIFPPPVQTELHDYAGPRGRQMGMPLSDFTNEAYTGLCSDTDTIVVGQVGYQKNFDEILSKRRETFEFLSGILNGFAAQAAKK